MFALNTFFRHLVVPQIAILFMVEYKTLFFPEKVFAARA